MAFIIPIISKQDKRKKNRRIHILLQQYKIKYNNKKTISVQIQICFKQRIRVKLILM